MTFDRKPAVYTLGHGRHPLQDFIALLQRHGIERVVDVRGQPYSRRNPQFNRESFAGALNQHRIDYVWAGEHLSGRPREPALYGPGGEVLWEKVRAGAGFNAALERVAADAAGRRQVLVCAEEDPLRCHRRFLLTPPLTARGVDVQHLRGDGRVEPEASLPAPEAGAGAQPDLFE